MGAHPQVQCPPGLGDVDERWLEIFFSLPTPPWKLKFLHVSPRA